MCKIQNKTKQHPILLLWLASVCHPSKEKGWCKVSNVITVTINRLCYDYESKHMLNRTILFNGFKLY